MGVPGLLLGYFLVIVIGAYQDFTRREVDDLISGVLWVLAWLIAPHYLGFWFGVFVVFSALFGYFFKKPLMGWADILILPPTMSVGVFLMNEYFFLVLGAFMILGGFIRQGEGGFPGVLYFALSIGVALFYAYPLTLL